MEVCLSEQVLSHRILMMPDFEIFHGKIFYLKVALVFWLCVGGQSNGRFDGSGSSPIQLLGSWGFQWTQGFPPGRRLSTFVLVQELSHCWGPTM